MSRERRARTRRSVLAGTGAALAAGLAGCSSDGPESGGQDPTGDGGAAGDGGAGGGSNGSATAGGPFVPVYDRVVDSLVEVRGYAEGGAVGQGSGFVAFDGTVVTNQHVVEDTLELVVGFTDGSTTTGELLGADVYSDLAAIDVGGAAPEAAAPLPFVEREPPVGTRVMAVGAPFGFGESASTGIVSGVDRSLPSQTGFSIADAVQTDAAVNPGNSGGPLVGLDGEVVGVISAGGGENIAFGISAALTRRVVPSLVETGEYEHSFVGVTLQSVRPPLVRANGFERSTGVYVHRVLDGSPADGVLRGSTGEGSALGTQVPTGGDLIVGLDGRSIRSLPGLSTHLALNTSPGDVLSVSVVRDGERRTVSLRLAARPEP